MIKSLSSSIWWPSKFENQTKDVAAYFEWEILLANAGQEIVLADMLYVRWNISGDDS